MIVTFRSSATESITMFGDIAKSLLRLMGASGQVPGALNAEDVPPALARLEAEVDSMKMRSAGATAAPAADNEDHSVDEDDDDAAAKQPPVALATRAVPLLSLLKRAAAADAEVIWEGK